MDERLQPLAVTPKTGDEQIHDDGRSLPFTVLGFWRWHASAVAGNALRGVFAEYLVACALGEAAGLRYEWDAFDLVTGSGVKVEVKSAAYLQSWQQARHSSISFNIRPTLGWDAHTNTSGTLRRRHADVYVFAILHHLDKGTLDPLNVAQWNFLVLSTTVLDTRLPHQQTITLGSLVKLNPTPCHFDGLASAVNAAAYPQTER
jgi:hypothetical protein